MTLLEQDISAEQVLLPVPGTLPAEAERSARRSLRSQIKHLERQLSDAFVTAFSMGELELTASAAPAQPRMMDIGELERVRDELAERLHCARVSISERAEEHEVNRRRLERMLLEPASHRFARVARADLGEPGCGVWQVRPRLGLIGMLMGWWQVKLSSGCPLGSGRGLGSAAHI